MNNIDLVILNIIQVSLLIFSLSIILKGILVTMSIRLNREEGFVFQIYVDDVAKLSPLVSTIVLTIFILLFWNKLTITTMLFVVIPIIFLNKLLLSLNRELKNWDFDENGSENYYEIK